MLREVNRIERNQERVIKFNMTIGKRLLYLVPIILIILTIASIINTDPKISDYLLIVFIIILVIVAINSIILMLGVVLTDKAFKIRLNFERRMGKPIASLNGFEIVRMRIRKTLGIIKLIVLFSLISLVIYTVWIALSYLEDEQDSSLQSTLRFAALGFTLIMGGLSLFVRSLRMNIKDVTGLVDYFQPSVHEIFIDNFFADSFREHLDPFTRLKWDEFIEVLNSCLKPEFVFQINQNEPDEVPVSFALEKLLYLSYLEYGKVLDRDTLKNELSEILSLETGNYSYEKGADIGLARRYFNAKDLHKIFEDSMHKYTAGFFSIVDRLQIELMDNIKIMKNDPIYMDVDTEEAIFLDNYLNIIIFLFNNFPDDKQYKIRIICPGFQPSDFEFKLNVEGRGSFEIPLLEELPLTSDYGDDCVGLMSSILKNGDCVWLSLVPVKKGTHTIEILLLDKEDNIIEGKLLSMDVDTDLKKRIKKFIGTVSVIVGLVTPLIEMLF